MAFVRKKIVAGEAYYSLVRSERVSGKVKQVLIASLGKNPTVKDEIDHLRFWADFYRERAERTRGRAGRSLVMTDGGTIFGYLVVGREAKTRAEMLERKIELLSKWKGVVTNGVYSCDTDCHYTEQVTR